MNPEVNDNKFISKNNSGFPDYLDWDKLRAEGIDYLGKLSGNIWTDHNTHDPGITILEILCYALMDLGYRTNLPVADIFAKDPTGLTESKENNFFTPPQILTCNPLTIMDFRKMIIDIEGVKNAWLEDSYYDSDAQPVSGTPGQGDNCIDFRYNGLYNVFVETEEGYPTKSYDQSADDCSLVTRIRKALQAHRNLCEDFIDPIHILAKKQIGLCADIELETGADVNEVYKNVIERLRAFFSPSPKFYTLQQLLEEKGKNIDEIFAGRPYDLKKSHGFVDTEEFEQIQLKKEIHLSDVYHIIFDVAGVRSVKNLGWIKNCSGKHSPPEKGWVWKIPKNHIPDFSAACSTFTFARHGVPVAADTVKVNALFSINFNHSGKVSYPIASPYLNVKMPDVFYRSDMGDYGSIQNEFPAVYGIANGGLPLEATARRKAQAYQLKGYLLFFDQLLANYVTQLKNIRSLFGFSPSPNNENATYFKNTLTDVSDFQKLVRFKVAGEEASVGGEHGTSLAIPLEREALELLIKNGEIKKVNCHRNIIPFTFPSLPQCDAATANLQEDLQHGEFEPVISSIENEAKWFFYFFTSSDEFALIASNFYDSKEKAREAAGTLRYAGVYSDNIKSFTNDQKNYTFSVELNLAGYADYLKRITEDEHLYSERRQGFLNHLLSRFAEKFTDFALLSFGVLGESELLKKKNADKENFLSSYDKLSSGRGRGYDYLLNGWNNSNVSGFESRVAALAGMGGANNKFLCNFVVEEYEKQYVFRIGFGGTDKLFTSENKYFSEESAATSALALSKALLSGDNYEVVEDKNTQSYFLKVKYAEKRRSFYGKRFATINDALFEAESLQGLFSNTPAKRDIYESKKIYKVILRDFLLNEIAVSKKNFTDIEKAEMFISAASESIMKPLNWDATGENKTFGRIYFNDANLDRLSFIDVEAFKIDIDNNIVGKPDKFKYELLDKLNNFKFISTSEFDSEVEAEKECISQIALLTKPENYFIYLNQKLPAYQLQLRRAKKVIAIYDTYFDKEAEAAEAKKNVINLVNGHQYFIAVEQRTIRWNFGIYIGHEKNNHFLFKSVSEFKSPELALQHAEEYYKATGTMQVLHRNNMPAISCSVNNENVICVYESQTGDEDVNQKIAGLVAVRRDVHAVVSNVSPEAGRQFVGNDEPDADLIYVYRLADRNNYHALYSGKTMPASKDEVLEIKNELFQNRIEYRVTDISLAGDIVMERKEGFHFQLKIQKPVDFLPAGTVLFESVKWFASGEQAIAAFETAFYDILRKAMQEENYGDEKFISLTKILPADYDTTKSIVFVPDPTVKILEAASQTPQAALAKIAMQYPVRYVLKTEQEFGERFGCGPNDCEEKFEPPCDADIAVAERYYFYILSDKDGKEQWQSVQYFPAREQAIHQFNFFHALLVSPGNFVVDWNSCSCGWKIFIREVLVQSQLRYNSPEAAWAGVEKFICVSQTTNPFHTYIDEKNDCFTFTVECDAFGLTHPCKYDTEMERNSARKELWQSFTKVNDWLIPAVKYEAGNCTVSDQWGMPIAVIRKDSQPVLSQECVSLPEIAKRIDENVLVYDEEKKQVTIGDTHYTLHPYDDSIGFEKWRKDLMEIFCFYPVRNKEGKYAIELRLPGVNCCGSDLPVPDVNRPAPVKGWGECDTSIAWQGTSVFDSYQDALDFYVSIKPCLNDPDNYKQVFDCLCGQYGIRLQCDCNISAMSEGDTSEFCSQVVAFNPQCYTTTQMCCEAVGRTEKLTNSEGLHLVEHILLRPRNESDCEFSLEYCDDRQREINCDKWTFKQGGDNDPCDNKTDDILFTAGGDPYSFIATLALPAWPKRFRSKQNRQIVENLLYQEAPAHVMLRILWLTPQNLWFFESHFRSWLLWTSGQHQDCFNNNPSHDFIRFLFSKNFECLADCLACDTATAVQQQNPACFNTDDTVQPCEDFDLTDKINELYCWATTNCLPQIAIPQEIIEAQLLALDEKNKVFNQRKDEYKKTILKAFPDQPEGDMNGAELVLFLNDPNPSVQRYTALIESIIKNDGHRMPAFSETQKPVLINTITYQFMDKVFVNDGSLHRVNELKSFFKLVETKTNINMKLVLLKWRQTKRTPV